MSEQRQYEMYGIINKLAASVENIEKHLVEMDERSTSIHMAFKEELVRSIEKNAKEFEKMNDRVTTLEGDKKTAIVVASGLGAGIMIVINKLVSLIKL